MSSTSLRCTGLSSTTFRLVTCPLSHGVCRVTLVVCSCVSCRLMKRQQVACGVCIWHMSISSQSLVVYRSTSLRSAAYCPVAWPLSSLGVLTSRLWHCQAVLNGKPDYWHVVCVLSSTDCLLSIAACCLTVAFLSFAVCRLSFVEYRFVDCCFYVY